MICLRLPQTFASMHKLIALLRYMSRLTVLSMGGCPSGASLETCHKGFDPIVGGCRSGVDSFFYF